MTGEVLSAASQATTLHLIKGALISIKELLLSSGFTALGGALFGALIAGYFNLRGIKENNKILLQIKKQELESAANTQAAQSASIKELKEAEVNHQKAMQNIEQQSQRNLRLLDEKIKIFSQFNQLYPKMFQGLDHDVMVTNCRKMRECVNALALFAPRLRKEVLEFENEIVDFTNYFKKGIVTKPKTKRALKKISALGSKISRELPVELVETA